MNTLEEFWEEEDASWETIFISWLRKGSINMEDAMDAAFKN